MNQAGELDYIGQYILQPHIAILTNLSITHYENFEHEHAIRNAKAELFQHVQHGGIMLLPYEVAQQDYWQDIAKQRSATIYHFSDKPNNEAHFQLLEYQDHHSPYCRIKIFEQEYPIMMPVYGGQHALNIAIALGVVSLCSLPLKQSLTSLSSYQLSKGRGASHECHHPIIGSFSIIDETYNASPLSVKLVIENFLTRPHQGRKIIILGDMLELGSKTKKEHASIAQNIITHKIPVITIGFYWEEAFTQLGGDILLASYRNSDEAIGTIDKHLKKDDIVLLKGSRSIELDKIVSHLQH